MTDHKYGPNGHIVDAFIEHLKQMTRDDWGKVHAAQDALWVVAQYAWAAAGDAAGRAARYAAWFAAGDAVWNAWNTWFAAGDAWDAAGVAREAVREAAWNAAWEIQGADLMRERGEPFVFLPMFGFADENAVLAALQPKEKTK